MAWGNFRNEVLIEVASLLDIALLLLKHGIFDGELNDIAGVVGTNARLAVLKLGTGQGHVLEAPLDKVHVVQPELQV